MSEEWRDVFGYEGFYQVSSMGRVRSVDRVIVRSTGHRQRYRGQVLSPRLGWRDRNYLLVTLRFGATRPVHALVCEAFHGPRPDGYQAAHYNGDSLDNRAGNLRWATPDGEHCGLSPARCLANQGPARRVERSRPPDLGDGRRHEGRLCCRNVATCCGQAVRNR